MKNVSVRVYDTLLACVLAFTCKEEPPCALKKWYIHGVGWRRNVEKFTVTSPPLCWGWAEYSTRSLHLWFSKDCPLDDRLDLIAHELAHVTWKRHKDRKLEERKALKAGRIAKHALNIAEIIERRSGYGQADGKGKKAYQEIELCSRGETISDS